MNYGRKKPTVYLPFLFAIVLSIGMYIGVKMANSDKKPSSIFTLNLGPKTKIDQILNFIDKRYVDTVKSEELIENGIYGVLKDLDPHTAYVPARDFVNMNEPLQGNFEGIGIEFNIINDTIVVISPISGGPSEVLGIKPGDRIVYIESELVAGTKITTNDVVSKLRGKKGTIVNVQICRKGFTDLFKYAIERDKIPINSLEFAYMINDEAGYIKLSRFASTTHDEFLNSLNNLIASGLKKLILDLRGNPGGYLNAAQDIADEFLSEKKLIVYTQGKNQPRQDLLATNRTSFETGNLIILIDEGSASASEIVAGAVQDWDRGIIMGRRSFGKGLVQEQTEFTDGSAIRLTVARYFTPTGRCIQKPYDKGRDVYEMETFERFELGELTNRDSMPVNDTIVYKTPSGRIVRGGGGIEPDVFISIDTSGNSPYLNKVFFTGLIHRFAFKYSDENRKLLNEKYQSFNIYLTDFGKSDEVLNLFIAYADENGLKKALPQIRKSKELLKMHLKALIARQVWGNERYYPVFQQFDPVFLKAVEYMKDDKLVKNILNPDSTMQVNTTQ